MEVMHPNAPTLKLVDGGPLVLRGYPGQLEASKLLGGDVSTPVHSPHFLHDFMSKRYPQSRTTGHSSPTIKKLLFWLLADTFPVKCGKFETCRYWNVQGFVSLIKQRITKTKVSGR